MNTEWRQGVQKKEEEVEEEVLEVEVPAVEKLKEVLSTLSNTLSEGFGVWGENNVS